MKYIKEILDALYSFYIAHTNLYLILFLLLPMILGILFSVFKSSRAILILGFFIFFTEICLSYFLYKLNIINQILIILVSTHQLYNFYVLVFYKNHFFQIKKFFVHKTVVGVFLGYILSIYALLSIEYFNTKIYGYLCK